MEFLCLFVTFSLVPAIIASSRGCSSVAWFFFSVVISPLLAFVLVLTLPNLKTPPTSQAP